MSFSGQALLALHLAAAIFALGPGTAAIMSTPRYIRKGDATIVRYLYRTTKIYAIGSVLVLAFGLGLAQVQHDFAKWWISVSITLYIVAVLLLVLILRDQRKAITALTALEPAASPGTVLAPAGGAPVTGGNEGGAQARSAEEPAEKPAGEAAQTDQPGDGGQPAAAPQPAAPAAPQPARQDPAKVAAVERARISSLSGVVALIWLASLVLMVWK
jgi:Ca2+/Na+ antiporter